MISSKFKWQALKVNNLTGQADTHTQTGADTLKCQFKIISKAMYEVTH
jgi:hypothetical protein